MGCSGASKPGTELEFVHLLMSRSSDPRVCRGPLLTLSIDKDRLRIVEEALMSDFACELLWSGYEGGPVGDLVIFTLCAVHWMDLICLATVRSHQFNQLAWFGAGTALLRQLCESARWDSKEISNMLMWQKAQLT